MREILACEFNSRASTAGIVALLRSLIEPPSEAQPSLFYQQQPHFQQQSPALAPPVNRTIRKLLSRMKRMHT